MSNKNDNIKDEQIDNSGVHERSRLKHTALSEYEDPDVIKVHKELKERVKEKRKKDKEQSKLNDLQYHKHERRSFKFVMKQWWYGMNKESKRISWPSPRYLITSFLIVALIVLILTALFFGVTEIFIALGILNS
ncbi:preprotein translocase subunit SecE [Mycoplasmoides pirum]|uniref:preprotein translocase subunit SecE n=1 Tax=Mycoplasmoides pirum TaxID=2122 RepID=UPI0006961906|nr:preprotein translocase subunit SecE [Mycoplasmoides pirum]